MPFATRTPVINGSVPPIYPSDSGGGAQRSATTLTASEAALNSVGAFVILPAGCVPVGVHLDCDVSMFADIGILNDAETTMSTATADGGAVWMAALGANSPTFLSYSKAMARVQPVGYDRKVGIKVTTAGVSGVHGLTMAYRSA
jgi:hypothetical protein